MTDSFGERMQREQGPDLDLGKIFRKYGLHADIVGYENLAIRNTILRPDSDIDDYAFDLPSNLLRHFPDILITNRMRKKSFLAEKKMTKETYRNFDIEFNSYHACFILDCGMGGSSVFFILCSESKLKACWAKDIKFDKIMIPNNRYSRRFLEEFKIEYGVHLDATMSECELCYDESGGSNTPFGLLSKESPFLIDLGYFIKKNLL